MRASRTYGSVRGDRGNPVPASVLNAQALPRWSTAAAGPAMMRPGYSPTGKPCFPTHVDPRQPLPPPEPSYATDAYIVARLGAAER